MAAELHSSKVRQFVRRVWRPATAAIVALGTSALAWVMGGQSLPAPLLAWFQAPALPVTLGGGAIIVALAAGVLMVRRGDRRRVERATAAAARAPIMPVGDVGWEADPMLRLTLIDDDLLQILGLPIDAVLGRRWDELPQATFAAGLKQALILASAGGRPLRDVDMGWQAADGGKQHIRLAAVPVRGPDGTPTGYVGTASDVTAFVESEKRLRFLSAHDALTGCSNRAALIEKLKAALARTTPSAPCTVIDIDIDRLSGINETYGSAVGDEVIRRSAERLRACLPEGGVLARPSGDRFVVLLQGVDAAGKDLGAVCAAALERPLDLAEGRLGISVSYGRYITVDSKDVPETCLRRAQLALRHARKAAVKGRTFDDTMEAGTVQARRLEEELKRAIEAETLSLAYQPLLCLHAKRITAVEALVRWRHPSLGTVSPGTFIPLAERTGLIHDLGRFVFAQATANLDRWGDLRIAVNLSPVQIRHPGFLDDLERLVVETGCDPTRIELEITESALMDDSSATLDILTKLRRMGFRLALDDFGTGYAGLGYLQVFPFDKIKIDQSFIKRLDNSSHALAIVRTIVRLGHELGLVVCAEGIEREDQLQALIEAGCDLIQGFHVSMPLAANRIDSLVAKQASLRSSGPRPATQASVPATA